MRAFLFSLLLMVCCGATAEPNALYYFGHMDTSMGRINFRLFKKEAPTHVANFVGLATGQIAYRDVKTGKKVEGKNFYKNMIFHKVHPNLGIQTGCPWGTGKGWPGFTIKEEKNELKFDKPYYMAMARIDGQKDSIGSQFFITTDRAPHLDEDYTIIGEVVSGKSIVKSISQVKRDAMMKPIETVKLNEVVIEPE